LDYNKIKMRGIDDLKKWSEETAEHVIHVENGNDKIPKAGEQPAPKKPVPEEIDLLGLDDFAPSPPKQTQQPRQEIMDDKPDVQNKNKFGPPPSKDGQKTAPQPAPAELDLLGLDAGPTHPTPQPRPQASQPAPAHNTLDLFDLNLNL
jgi:hypothetical protein